MAFGWTRRHYFGDKINFEYFQNLETWKQKAETRKRELEQGRRRSSQLEPDEGKDKGGEEEQREPAEDEPETEAETATEAETETEATEEEKLDEVKSVWPWWDYEDAKGLTIKSVWP